MELDPWVLFQTYKYPMGGFHGSGSLVGRKNTQSVVNYKKKHSLFWIFPRISLVWIISFRNDKPFKVTFTRALFFPGLKGKNEIIGMVRTYIGKTAPECLVSDSVLFTVLTFHFFRHGNFLLFFFSYILFPANG
jgi:hypothetical protein